MRLAACLLALLTGVCFAEALTVRKHVVSSEAIRGAAMARDGGLFTWGDSLTVRGNATGKPRVLARGPFGEGGCLVDLDGDGQEEFVGKQGPGLGPLTWRKPPDWQPVVMEAETDTHDCLEATLFGRKGVLTIHRHMQVRFYERAGTGKPWSVREIYSIYTPSRQTGLSLRDVDGDGFVDILSGNYWIQSPPRFDLPWRIFAINTWFESPESAMHAHAMAGDALFVAQAHMTPARLALFRKPGDPRQLWDESRVPGEFNQVHAVLQVDGRVLFGENHGKASRIFRLQDGTAFQLATGFGSLRLFAVSGGILSVGPRDIVVWNYRRK